jgi:hypothetical protein
MRPITEDLTVAAVAMSFATGCFLIGCTEEIQSSSGLKQVQTTVTPEKNGLSTEQNNIKRRIELENTPGSIKHLYIVSTETGQVLVYSTVKGKVTSSSKRLLPSSVRASGGVAFSVKIGENTFYTNEVMQDDGTFGSSIPYLYWWDAQDRYHQHYVSGGQMPHLSDQPIEINQTTKQLELVKVAAPEAKPEGDKK